MLAGALPLTILLTPVIRIYRFLWWTVISLLFWWAVISLLFWWTDISLLF